MPTNDEIFAGPNKELDNDNIIQVAKEYRNIEIVAKFNAGRTTDLIHRSTVGARICRSIKRIAERDGRDRQELKEEFEAARVRNGVAGCNQHTVAGKKRPADEVEEDSDEGEDQEETGDVSPTPAAHKATPRKARKLEGVVDAGDAAASSSPPARKERPKRKTVTPPKYKLRRDSEPDEEESTSSLEASDESRAKKATPLAGPGSADKRRDSAAGSTATASPLLGKTRRTRASVASALSAAGKKRERVEDAEADGASSQQDSRPQKKAKTTNSGTTSSSAAPKASKPANGKAATSQRHKRASAPDNSSPSSNGSSDLGSRSATPSPPTKSAVSSPAESDTSGTPDTAERTRRFLQQLDDAEADTLFADYSPIHDDQVLELAGRLAIPEIIASANRSAGYHRYTAAAVVRRIARAVNNMATRKGWSVRRVEGDLEQKRAKNGVEAGGTGRRQ